MGALDGDGNQRTTAVRAAESHEMTTPARGGAFLGGVADLTPPPPPALAFHLLLLLLHRAQRRPGLDQVVRPEVVVVQVGDGE